MCTQSNHGGKNIITLIKVCVLRLNGASDSVIINLHTQISHSISCRILSPYFISLTFISSSLSLFSRSLISLHFLTSLHISYHHPKLYIFFISLSLLLSLFHSVVHFSGYISFWYQHLISQSFPSFLYLFWCLSLSIYLPGIYFCDPQTTKCNEN